MLEPDKSKTNVVSALTARTQFGQIMRRAKEENARFVVDHNGEPQVVIMGIDYFIRTIALEHDVITRIRADAKRKRKHSISSLEIDREIRAYRREKKNGA
ncbi:MAG TPA: type II toxin-antitoxin system prevent-host-death family antitoxin [Blastocatellia bacterium]|nr:type II toxin-antitoxin system prevent-host-death family antitoxin [Blastocatellia bacterium]